MASEAQELKQLNKSVTDAVNILKAWVGSSAQVKNMNEKQKEVISKWFEVAEDQKEHTKRQRAFTERARDSQGRFISKQNKSTSMFMNMTKIVGGMFSKMTKGVTTSISSLTSGLMSRLSSFFQAVKNQFLGLFGEESEWFELIGSVKDSIVNIGSGMFNFIFRRTPVWAGKQIKLLKQMYKLQLKQMKMEFLDAAGTKKKGFDWKSILITILVGMAAGIGAWVHRYLIALTKLPIFSKIARMFQTIDDIPFIGKLFKGVKYGFKWLGWPLTLLMSVIDFIKGFKEMEGPLFEKIKEGLWSALEGFIELPIKLVGWLTEKVLNLFGVEVEGLSKKFMDITRTGFMMIFNGWKLLFDPKTWSELFDWSKDIVAAIAGKAREWKDAIVDSITNIVFGVVNFFTGFWNNMVDFMASKIPSWIPGSSSLIKGLKSMQLDMTTPGGDVAAAAIETDKMRIANRTAQQKETAAGLKELNENVRLGTAENRNAISSMANIQKGGNSTTIVDQQQIPDEIDNNLISIANYGGA